MTGQDAPVTRRQALTGGAALAVAGAARGDGLARPVNAPPPQALAICPPPQALAIYPPSGDASGIPDTGVINGLLAAGTVVQLTAGTYFVNAPVSIPPSGVLVGTGRGQVDASDMTVVRAVAPMPAVIASTGWTSGANTRTQGGIRVGLLKVDGNSLARHGVVIQNYSSLIHDVYVSGYSSCGMRLDGVSRSGTVHIAGSGVNNQVVRCLAQGSVNPFFVNDPGGIFTDGLLEDCFFTDYSGSAVTIPRAAGWRIAGCHLYGLATHGFTLSQLLMTRITGNYVESWGGSASAGAYLALDAGFNGGNSDEGSGSVIAGNTLNLLNAPGSTGSTLVAIGFSCLNGNTASVAVTGNVARCAPLATRFTAAYASWYANQGARSTQLVATTGNQYPGNWTAVNHQTPNGGTITLNAGS